MSRIIFASILAIVFFAQNAYTQPLSAWIKAGDEAFNKKHYDAANQYYGVALEYYDPDSSNYELWYKYAESARLFGLFNRAEKGYRNIYNHTSKVNYPLTARWLAEVAQRLGHYPEARALYQKFLDEQPNAEASHRQAAEKGIADCIWAEEVMANRSDRVKLSHYTSESNSAYSDFGVAFKGDTLYYSSFQFINNKDTVNPARPYVKILQAPGGVGPKPLSDSINIPGKHVGHTAFNEQNRVVYYTICDYVGASSDVRCDLYSSVLLPGNVWGPAQQLSINSTGATNTQPSVGEDLATGQRWLYFTSDRSGGKGGLDIWRSAIAADGTLGAPENVAALNTTGNESTPFYHDISSTLFFSSDAYPTLGGYDVYQSRQSGSNWQTPEHLGVPINTSYNDVYFMFSGMGAEGYLSSNRPDTSAVFWDDTKEFCCNDIYKFEFNNKVDLRITTFNLLDSQALAGAKVGLYEMTPEGPKLVTTIENPTGNDFTFPVEIGKKYKVIAERPGFGPAEQTIDLSNYNLFNAPPHIDRPMYLAPGIRLDVTTFHKLDSTDLTGATVELYKILPNGQKELVKKITNADGNDFPFVLDRGQKYLLKSTKPGYRPEEEEIDLGKPEYANVNQIEKKVYLGQFLKALTYDGDDGKPLDGVKVELYELGPNGPQLVDSLTNLTGNEFNYAIDLNKKYLIKASKLGYADVVDTLQNLDKIADANGVATIRLDLERVSFADFLPLNLYFDNAVPGPKDKTTTPDAYLPLSTTYLDRKDAFIEQNTAGLNNEERFTRTRRFNDFFTRELVKGRQNLEDFSDKLYLFLSKGNTITISVRGYCSPRGSTQYNEMLSYRRIDAVKNHFERYKNGAIMPYIKSGKLVIKEEAFGESTAPKNISDRLNDPKDSIFGILATLERRVEITDAKTGNNK